MIKKTNIIENKSKKLAIEFHKFIEILNIDEDFITKIDNKIIETISSLLLIDYINNKEEEYEKMDTQNIL